MDGVLKDVLVTVAAVGGLVLGIINTAVTLMARSTKLRVVAVDKPKGSVILFAVEIVNLSAHPVTVNQIGIAQSNLLGRLLNRARSILQPQRVTLGGIPMHAVNEADEKLPVHIKAGDSLTLTGDVQQYITTDMPLRRVYVRLATGETFYGEGPALKRLQRGKQAMQSH